MEHSLIEMLQQKLTPTISTAAPIWQPADKNEPQRLAFELAQSGLVDEIGYGGQAGGGKTDLALGLAGTVFKKSLILRREFPQLRDIIDRGDSVYPVSFVGGPKKRWEWDGHIVTLGSLQYKDDWKKYQGQARELVAVDEAAEFPEEGVRAVTGWLRAEPGRHTLLLLCFNPPTDSEGEWIIQFFAPWLDADHPNPAEPGEIRYFAMLPGKDGGESKMVEVDSPDPIELADETVYPIRRTFIPASRYDNPFLGEEYERRLDALPEPLRSMVKTGKFNLATSDNPWQVVPTAWIQAAQARRTDIPKPDVALRSYAVDVARGGEDATVIQKLYGVWFDEPVEIAGIHTADGPEAAREVINALGSENAPGGIDVIGYGSSAYDSLKQMDGIKITPINFAEGAKRNGMPLKDNSGKFTFANLRAYVYWSFRQALDPSSGEDIALPEGRSLRAELAAARYEIVAGKIKIEDKEEIKSRIHRSPDRADAIVMAWYIANRPVVTPGVGRNING